MGTIITLAVLWTSLWMYLESRKFGYDKRDIKGMAAIGPRGWFFAGLLLWIVAFPLYLASRQKLKAAGEARRQKLASEGAERKRPSKVGPVFAFAAIGFITLAVIGNHLPKAPATPAMAAAPTEPQVAPLPAPAPVPAPAPAAQASKPVATESVTKPPAASPLKLTQFRSYVRTCKEVARDVTDGQPRVFCQRRGVVPTLFEAIGPEKSLAKVTLIVGVDEKHAAESLVAAFKFINDVTGRKVGEIAPDGWLENIADGNERSFSYNGLTIETQAYPPIGMIRFTAIAE